MMKFTQAARCLGAGIVVTLVSACGGGGGGGTGPTVAPPPPPQASLQVSGTAAIGAALASASVQVKCTTGSGTAATAADGSYTLAIQGGALPCLLKVTGSAGGTAVTLHSVADSGSTDAASAVTSARANATPLTELILAQLTGKLPETSFTAFNAGAGADLSATKVAAAAEAVLAMLKIAGIDPGAVDPFKGALVAGTGSAPGDAHDQLLVRFAARIATRALPQLVNELVVATTAQPAAAATTAAALLGGGTLAGCPTALSGRYRTITFFGRTGVRAIDFQAMKIQAFDSAEQRDIVADPAKPCTFTSRSVFAGRATEISIAMGPQGVGIYRTRFVDPNSPGVVGYIFPSQTHTLAEVAGSWSFLQSGYTPGQSTDTAGGQFTLGADGKLATCLFDRTKNWACGDPMARTVTQRSDGGFDLAATADLPAAQVYAYRAPDGNVTLFGTTNPNSDNEFPELTQTSIVAAKLQALPLPAIGDTEKFWEAGFTQLSGQNFTFAPTANSLTVTQVNAATSTAVRTLPPDGPSFTHHYNQPLAGVVTHDAGAGLPGLYELPLPGLGVAVSVNSEPAVSTGQTNFYLKVMQP